MTGGRVEVAFRGSIDALTDEERTRLMDRRPRDDDEVRGAVREILADVVTRGDEALLEMAERFDGVRLDAVEVPRARWREALERLDPEVREALRRAARNVEHFHAAQVPEEVVVETEPGVRLGRRFVPVGCVGVYAPGGRAAYPSSVLMGVVPARAVGVPEIVVCSPPGPDGSPPHAVLAAAEIAAASRLFAVGGAGAVGAMAYGTGSIPRCDAVVGPGNRWVMEAKRQIAGEVIIDSPAGPSEVLVLADASTDPGRAADELIAQAEHDPDAAVVLVATDEGVLEATERALLSAIDETPRTDVVREALAGQGGLLLAHDPEEARRFTADWGAEHLSILTADPWADLERIPTAGTVFLGESASVAYGDYLTGANHVLPTGGTSRSFSGLSALDFLRSYTWQEISAEGAAGMAEAVARLAEAEGLPGHAAAARSAAGGDR